ncbi:ABC transporter [Rhizoctonia solani]|uniref:ABC transporter n=1 Tax=Rhizoctonia solani TaxID=456999 RepID=A0A8H7IHQ6_9AGAM|nr:ABC transporter [Rhizoctonia solani]
MSYLDSVDRQRPTTANSDPATAVPSRTPSENIELSDVEKKHHGEHQDGVNVKEAEAQFNALARRLTRQSTKHQEAFGGDVEKQETFDLLEYLRSTSGKQDEAGFSKKHVGVTFENLRVTGVGGVKIYVRTFPDAVKEFFLSPYYIAKSLVGGPGGAPKTILHSFNGAVRPGEMVLVLGRPGSGCSSFLKTIANQRGSFLSVDGDVQYAGIGASEFEKRYAGQAAYNMEDDIHYPILSVAQTLQFALKLKSPGRLLPEQTRAQLNDEVLDTLLAMLNITHTAIPWLEMNSSVASRACVCSWDNSTRGLDASTALDYAKSLRIMTDIFKLTTFVSLYQAGEGITTSSTRCCSSTKVVRCTLDLPRSTDYMLSLGFRNLPRQTTADYLTGCTDPNERAFAEGRSEADAEWQQEANDPAGAQAQFLQANKEEKRKHVSRKDPHTVSFVSMVKTLVWRQWLMQIQDTFSIFTSFATAIIIAIVAGSLYLNLPLTAAGGFTRGGVVFMALLVQRSQCIHALSVAQTITDIPLTSIRILLFCIIIYFMTGLERSAGAFFTFYLFTYTTFLAMTAFFRLIGIICTGYDVAARLAAVLITLMVIYAGYMIPVYSMKRWLFWIWYMNPLNYGFASMMENEFYRIDLQCVGNYIIPRNVGGITKYPSELGPNQACTLLGASPGNPLVSGDAYMAASFEYAKKDIWRNFGILVLFFVAFVALQIVAMEKFQHGAHARAITIYAKEKKENKELNDRLKQRKAAGRKGQDEDTVSGALTKSTKAFTWENLDYTVPVPGGTRQLLNKVFGYVKPGTLTALMGSSGAGKTTLLDVLAGRKTIVSSTVTSSSAAKRTGIAFQRGTAYCEQLDVPRVHCHRPRGSPLLCISPQPYEVSKEEKDAYVEEVIALLEMEDIADAMIGQPGVGTRKLAAGGQAILCTIISRTTLFEQFDNLLLLQRGGECVYFGPIGKDSQHLVKYLADRGADCPPDANPAEYVLEPSVLAQDRSERTLTAFWRQPDYGFTRLFSHGAIALLTSLTFLQLGNSTQDLQYLEPMFIIARMIFIRESSSRMYSQFVFALGQLMAEMPYSVLCAVVYFLLFYYPAGFNTASDRAGYHFFMILITEIFSVTLGQMLAALTPSVYIASLLNPFILVTFSLFCGVTIPKASMPKFWRAWLYHLDPFTRMISGLVSTELHGLPITCSPIEFSIFQPPSGQTCMQWAGDFVNATVGYLDNPKLVLTADTALTPSVMTSTSVSISHSTLAGAISALQVCEAVNVLSPICIARLFHHIVFTLFVAEKIVFFARSPSYFSPAWSLMK